CHFCHGHSKRVIGVLNVNYSLSETSQRIAEAKKLFLFATIVIIFFLSLAVSFVMFKFVREPLSKLVGNMSRVEAGDLSVRMESESKDEVGRLIVSFDSMVQRLDQAKAELEQCHYQQMERADRLASVGEMAAGIAHEIKNPLTGIASATCIIRDDFADDDPRRQIAGEILEQLERLDKTANDLLYFGRPSQPELTHVDINDLLRRTIDFSTRHRGCAGITRQIALAEGLPPVYVDSKQIQQVLLNLILNAVQAMCGGNGLLSLRSSQIDRQGKAWVRVEVADTGPGIPPTILEKIFTPFFTTKAQGTGLGLAICHKLVTQLGGTIEVASELGKGTTFSIDLPTAPLGS
ncbi:MAG TPA: ATP-binding protein, partial [Geobacterales bacterium]|nr:ATP-binding protein [Geobacterales bacterium]